MIRPVFVVLADSVIQDRQTNAMSIINMIEEVHTAGYPLLVPRLAVFCMFERDEGDDAAGQAQLAISLSDEAVFENTFDVEFGEGLLSRAVLRFEGFVLPNAGRIHARVTIGDAAATSFSIAAFPAGTQPPDIQQGPA